MPLFEFKEKKDNFEFRNSDASVLGVSKEVVVAKNCILDLKTGLAYSLNENSVIWDASEEYLAWFNGRDAEWISSDPRWKSKILKNYLIAERMEACEKYVKGNIDNIEDIEKLDYIEGNSINFLHPFDFYVYGHFFDTFHKSLILEKNNIPYDNLICRSFHTIKDHSEHIQAMGLDSDKIRIMPNSGMVKVENLIYPVPQSAPSQFTDYTLNGLASKYRKFYNVKPLKIKYKLFLTRRKGSVKRFILNADALESELIKKGIVILDGTENLSEIVNYFSNASHICGPHGSLFMSSMFTDSACKFKEFSPKDRVNMAFCFQYQNIRSYSFDLVDTDTDFNFNLDLQAIKNFYEV